MVNIKKYNGQKTSLHSNLETHFNENNQPLKAQIESINPQIIITGGTFKYLERLFDGITEVEHGKLSDNIGFYHITSKDILIVRLRHPSYSEATKVRYYHALQKRYRQIYAEVKKW